MYHFRHHLCYFFLKCAWLPGSTPRTPLGGIQRLPGPHLIFSRQRVRAAGAQSLRPLMQGEPLSEILAMDLMFPPPTQKKTEAPPPPSQVTSAGYGPASKHNNMLYAYALTTYHCSLFIGEVIYMIYFYIHSRPANKRSSG